MGDQLKSSMTVEEAVGYLDKNLRKSIINDVSPILDRWCSQSEGGYFGVTRLVLCYVDYLGALYCGTQGDNNPRHLATSKKAKTYINEVMSRVDPLYGEEDIANLLYEMYRHGTVHLYEPKRFVDKTHSRCLEWHVNKYPRSWMGSDGRVWRHLKPLHHLAEQWVFPVSIVCLYEDLVASIDVFITMLREEAVCGKDTLLRNFQSAANLILQPEEVDWAW